MPIYAYRCEACGHAKDVLQKVSDPVLTVCPACGASSFKKQLTAAGFQLKGSGWYVTDFRGNSNSNGAVSHPDANPDAKPEAGGGGAEPSASASSDTSGSTPAAGCGASCACQ
jgi:putative FmdB family regulatory protein